MSKDKKIISFPNKSKRIIDKAEALIDKRKFQEAYNHLENSKENIFEVEFLKIVCLTYLNRVEDAIVKCKQILEIKYVAEVQFLYIGLLKSVGKDFEASLEMITFEAMNTENEEDFSQISEGLTEEIDISIKEFREVMMDSSNLQEQDAMIRILENQDIIPYFTIIKIVLKDIKASNTLKSMLLKSLYNHKVKRKVVVTKFNREMSMLGDKSPKKSQKWSEKVEVEILRLLDINNPMLFNRVIELWNSFMFLSYPFIFDEVSSEIWAHAVIRHLSAISGEEISDTKMKEFYFTNQEQIREAIELLEHTIDISGKVL